MGLAGPCGWGRGAVGGWYGKVAGRVAFELQASEELTGRRVRIADGDAGLANLREQRLSGGLLLVGDVEVVGESGFGGAVLVGVGLDFTQQRGEIGDVDGVVGDKLGQIVLLVGDVDVEVEVLRIDAADPQVGDVAHHADGHEGVELGDGVLRGGGGVFGGFDAGDLLQARGPARGVVVLGVEALGAGVGEGLDERSGGDGGLEVAQPGDLIIAIVVEGGDERLVVGVVRPAQAGEILLRDDGLDVVGVLRGVGRGGGLAAAVASGEEAEENEGGDGGTA